MGAFGTIFDVGHAAGPICAGMLIGWGGYQVSFSLLGDSCVLPSQFSCAMCHRIDCCGNIAIILASSPRMRLFQHDQMLSVALHRPTKEFT